MDSVKEFFVNTWAKIVAALTILLGILWYFLSLKNKKINALEAKVDLAETQKEADLIEAEIREKRDQEGLLKKEAEEHERLLKDLEEKRKQLPDDQANKTPSEIEKYWQGK
jgi:septal ring factor EnvC (AmiA/AmiB activator)